ncbi:MAG: DUF86 domain-containing protein [archaeon]
MSGLRKDLIDKKIVGIVDNLEILREGLPKSFGEFKKMGLKKDGIYKRIESSIELILDICNIVNSDFGFGIPEDEGNSIDNLEENGKLSGESAELVRKMRGFRNILVHRYGEVDDKQAFEMIKEGIEDFKKVIKEFEK